MNLLLSLHFPGLCQNHTASAHGIQFEFNQIHLYILYQVFIDQPVVTFRTVVL